MAEQWAISGVDLHLERTGPGLRRGLTDALREAVRTGRLGAGTRLPSSRTLAADLGIARNTVAAVYADLVAEGWLTARQGAGTRVAERRVSAPDGAVPPPRTHPRPRNDQRPGRPDVSAIPRGGWLQAAPPPVAAAAPEAWG
ncbi:winged helix-turn-helix domain-containing protein [Nocardia farcinica]|uniref:winged helix-turn-helix domain-containing protein n=1 Tax=Nocardia farcinica TaxID=37329 RepID=UPI00245534B4|nr:winged helix-turn-helix domain-containing protein [Nocardia farcinica]